MIKITKLKYGKYNQKFFIKYIAENRNFICVVDGEIVSAEEGNNIFRKLKSEWENCIVEVDIINKNNNEIIEYLDSQIDKYVQYIDNYYQMKKAEENNNRIRNLISEFESIC